MRILLDILPLQMMGGSGGAASFTKAIIDGILSRRTADMELFGAFNSGIHVNERFDVTVLAESLGLQLLDISSTPLREIIKDNGIDVFFISIGQWYSQYDLKGISCRVVMFIHDIFDSERNENKIDLTLYDPYHDSWWAYMKRAINLWSGRWKKQAAKCYDSIIPLFSAANTTAYTVSQYSRRCLQYHFPQIRHDIKVCWSPLLEVPESKEVENKQLKSLISSGKPYLLVMLCHRRYKNAAKVIRVFERLQQEYPDLMLLSLRNGTTISDRHIDIRFLSDSDLQQAYRHAHCLVFPSFFEGFGYPPIEAMRYGTPVVASNVTSIPEVVGDGACLMSPFYIADIYRAIKTVLDHHKEYAARAQKRYTEVVQRQQQDLELLIDDILTNTQHK